MGHTLSFPQEGQNIMGVGFGPQLTYKDKYFTPWVQESTSMLTLILGRDYERNMYWPMLFMTRLVHGQASSFFKIC